MMNPWVLGPYVWTNPNDKSVLKYHLQPGFWNWVGTMSRLPLLQKRLERLLLSEWDIKTSSIWLRVETLVSRWTSEQLVVMDIHTPKNCSYIDIHSPFTNLILQMLNAPPKPRFI
jgi:hypothetical protein